MADCSQYQTKLNDLIRRANVVVEQYDFISGAAPSAPLPILENYLNTVTQLRNSIIPKIENELFTLNREAIDAGCRDIGEKAADALRRIQFGLSQNMFILEANLKKTINTLSKQAAETQKATTTQDNAGTGATGSSPAAQAGAAAAAPTTTPPPPTQDLKPVPSTEGTDPPPATGTSASTAPKPVTEPAPAPATTPPPSTATTSPTTVDPKTGTQQTKPATTTVPSTKGAPGTVEYVASLIAQKPVEGANALATACPDKSAAIAKVKKLLADLNAQIAAQIPTAKGADGKPATATERNALSAQLQDANSKLSKNLKDIEATKCDPPPAPEEPAPTPEAAKPNTNSGLPGQTTITQTQGSLQDETNFQAREDWRVRLALTPECDYLYRAKSPGILAPLAKTDGILFPYTPGINVTYSANYDDVLPTHSNYRVYQYGSSSVDNIIITCDFTAQDTFEATYLLATIHFLRSMTKMFYGKDENPKPGIPPPLCFLYGLGEFQFNAHPLVIQNFTYSLPTDVDYIRADTSGKAVTTAGAPQTNASTDATTNVNEGTKQGRLDQIKGFIGGVLWPTNVDAGGKLSVPNFSANQPAGVIQPTYVPTKMQISITCLPIVSRNNVSNKFSLRDYASGELLRGVKNKSGGFW